MTYQDIMTGAWRSAMLRNTQKQSAPPECGCIVLIVIIVGLCGITWYEISNLLEQNKKDDYQQEQWDAITAAQKEVAKYNQDSYKTKAKMIAARKFINGEIDPIEFKPEDEIWQPIDGIVSDVIVSDALNGGIARGSWVLPADKFGYDVIIVYQAYWKRSDGKPPIKWGEPGKIAFPIHVPLSAVK